MKRISENIKNIDGTFLHSDNERLNRSKGYFQSLYNRPRPESNPVDPAHLQDVAISINDKEPTIDEIKFAIKQLKLGKTAGPDEVIAETIEAGGKPILGRLRSLLQMIWHSDNIPNTWKKRLIVPLFKKGDNGECKNYRGISLLSAVGKVFTKVIQQRLQQKREQVAREEQAGFRPERGCCDQIFVPRQLLEERIRCGKSLVVVFIDFISAFDSVHQTALWKSLVVEEVPGKIIHLLQQVYEGTTSCVRVNRRTSEDFPVHTGIRQSYVSLPIFSIPSWMQS